MFYLLHALTFMCCLCLLEVLEKRKEGQYLCSAFGEEAKKWTGGVLGGQAREVVMLRACWLVWYLYLDLFYDDVLF